MTNSQPLVCGSMSISFKHFGQSFKFLKIEKMTSVEIMQNMKKSNPLTKETTIKMFYPYSMNTYKHLVINK